MKNCRRFSTMLLLALIFAGLPLATNNLFSNYNSVQVRYLRTKGRAFVLFTSNQTMNRAAERLRPGFADRGLELFLQGEGLSTSALVEAAVETTRRFGIEPQLEVGSTDANIPMSMGIPAIALGGGGASGNVHTLDEWFDPSGRDLGIQRLVALIAVRAGLK